VHKTGKNEGTTNQVCNCLRGLAGWDIISAIYFEHLFFANSGGWGDFILSDGINLFVVAMLQYHFVCSVL
jgi:hypothetical protein